jgi:hypothetical protein
VLCNGFVAFTSSLILVRCYGLGERPLYSCIYYEHIRILGQDSCDLSLNTERSRCVGLGCHSLCSTNNFMNHPTSLRCLRQFFHTMFRQSNLPNALTLFDRNESRIGNVPSLVPGVVKWIVHSSVSLSRTECRVKVPMFPSVSPIWLDFEGAPIPCRPEKLEKLTSPSYLPTSLVSAGPPRILSRA